jgi:hypothetical protein
MVKTYILWHAALKPEYRNQSRRLLIDNGPDNETHSHGRLPEDIHYQVRQGLS